MLLHAVTTIVPAHVTSVSAQDLVDDMCPVDCEHAEDVVPFSRGLP